MEKTIFERIAAREIPAEIFWENEDFVAFLDIRPVSPGHSLVVPKRNLGGYIFDLSDENYQALMAAAKEVAKVMEKKYASERIFVWVQGVEVDHVHVHLIPQGDVGINELMS